MGNSTIQDLNICTEIISVALWVHYMSVGGDQDVSGK